jgi:hypothetical protein
MQPRVWFAASVAASVAGCAAPPKPIPSAPAAALAAPTRATVVAARPLGQAEFRGAVLIVLTGAAVPPTDVPPGAELVVQTRDGRTLSCISHATPPPRVGTSVLLPPGPACRRDADIAGTPAIR